MQTGDRGPPVANLKAIMAPRASLPKRFLWHSLSLVERVAIMRRAPEASSYPGPSVPIRAHLERVFPGGAGFAQWLAALQISEAEFNAASHSLSHDQERRLDCVGPWQKLLKDVLAPDFLQSAAKDVTPTGTVSDLLYPLLAWARCELGVIEGHPKGVIDTEGVRHSLLMQLTANLASVFQDTFILEVNAARLEGRLQGDSGQARLQSFTRQYLDQPQRLRRLLLSYPVLTRLLATISLNWLENSLSLVSAVLADREAIRMTFFPDRDGGVLREVVAAGSDPHDGGKQVLILRFSHGGRLIYKPRSLAVDIALERVTEWIERHCRADGEEMPRLRILPRPTYGWVEFIEHRPCRSVEEVRKFYRRVGAYLALLRALCATDFHMENLIASGSDPVLVDLEALFSSLSSLRLKAELHSPAGFFLSSSVLESGLLPNPVPLNDRLPMPDMSALGFRGDQTWGVQAPVVKSESSDDIHRIWEAMPIGAAQNRPFLAMGEVSFLDYEAEVFEGFQSWYAMLVAAGPELLSPNGPLHTLDSLRVRQILRPTLLYGRLLLRGRHPDYLRNAIDRDLLLARLGVVTNEVDFWRVVVSEVRTLWNEDIPRLESEAGSRDLILRDDRIADFFPRSGMTMAKNRIAELGVADLRRQEELIRMSFSLTRWAEREQSRQDAECVEPGRTQPAGDADLRDEIRDIARWLCDAAIIDGPVAEWYGLQENDFKQFAIMPAGSSLYDGTAGISVFLARAGLLLEEERYIDLGLSAFEFARRHLLETRIPPGGAFSGRASIAYAALQLGLLLERPDIVELSLAAVPTLTQGLGRDRTFDVVGGSAGAVAVLLALHRTTGAQEPLAAARAFGDHLVANALPQTHGHAWPFPGGPVPLTGFSHGAAGIAWALVHLGALTGYEPYCDAGRAGFKYERGHYSSTDQSWTDLRPPLPGQQATNTKGGMVAWCHGAAGIGLARVSLPSDAMEAAEYAEAETAIQAICRSALGFSDSLCHGEFGNMETLLVAAQALKRPALADLVRRRVSAALLRRRRVGQWRCGLPQRQPVPGLMVGIAGVGYGLLRVLDPDTPSVLCVEAARPLRHDLKRQATREPATVQSQVE